MKMQKAKLNTNNLIFPTQVNNKSLVYYFSFYGPPKAILQHVFSTAWTFTQMLQFP